MAVNSKKLGLADRVLDGVAEIVSEPQQLPAGFGATGPLARSLFLMGWIEEQTLIARLKGQGITIITGCGHPTIELMVQMVKTPWQRITDADLTSTVSFLRKVVPQKLLLSAPDSCDHALRRISDELQCDTRILKAGETYDLQGG
ncbi:hypothetical protein [Desulfosediminicola sp.]|uniref:hypothetical protein n=1 Tax=Desulfosediminicola sp. TaxID=2886825 RepID=UPI003AF2B48F